MADETEDEVVVQIEPDEKPEKAEGDVKVTTDADPAVAEAKSQYDKLAQERDAERARAEAAERQAAEHRRRAEASAQEAHSARAQSLKLFASTRQNPSSKRASSSRGRKSDPYLMIRSKTIYRAGRSRPSGGY